MTTTTFIRPVLHSSDHVISSLPFLLGFIPHSSAVLLWLRKERLVLTQRVDLPAAFSRDVSADALHEWADDVTSAARHIDADHVLIALFPDAYICEAGTQHQQSCVASALCGSLIEIGVYPNAIWLAHEDEWCEFDFGSATFSTFVHVLDPRIAAEVAQDFTSAGFAFFEQRSDLIDEVKGNAEDQKTALRAIQDDSCVGVDSDDEQRRDELINVVMRSLNSGATDTHEIGLLYVALLDVNIRDCVLWKLSEDIAQAELCAHLRALVRSAPPGLRAPIATVCAIYSWMLGDGARANVALEQALVDDPTYGLGLLLQIALTNAVPPSQWIEMMHKMSYGSARWSGAPRNQ